MLYKNVNAIGNARHIKKFNKMKIIKIVMSVEKKHVELHNKTVLILIKSWESERENDRFHIDVEEDTHTLESINDWWTQVFNLKKIILLILMGKNIPDYSFTIGSILTN